MANFKQMPLKNCLAVTQQVTDLCVACQRQNHQTEGEYVTLTHATYVSFHHPLLQMNPFSHFLSFFFFSFFFFALSFIGPAGQLDSSVSRTKETKWNRERAVMSNSSYSVTYRPAVVWGSLLETMEGFERSGALWSPSLIEFPGTGLQCWDWLWSGSCGFREGVRTLLCADLSQTQVGWSGKGWRRRRRRGATGEAYCGARWMQRWHSITLDLVASIHLRRIFSPLLCHWQITCSGNRLLCVCFLILLDNQIALF